MARYPRRFFCVEVTFCCFFSRVLLEVDFPLMLEGDLALF